MPIAQALATFRVKSSQCDSLISNAHKADAAGTPLFPQIDREQITVAAFLNLFVAWEEFVESVISHFLAGAATLSGKQPIRYAVPSTPEDAKKMMIGANRYFDYANHELVLRMVRLYFENGYPFEPNLSSILSDLADLRTLRNSSAHISSTTQVALEALAQRIFGTPKPGITLYAMLTAVDPRSMGGNTVLAEARDKLLINCTTDRPRITFLSSSAIQDLPAVQTGQRDRQFRPTFRRSRNRHYWPLIPRELSFDNADFSGRR
ncbi:hypothetical protein [Methylococcus sp. EFPC2]|uniref:hypothetical protein n=1 Tax=Methylococcus sp. EFPC2 TaxID=2812648 RepID=UPI001966DBD1|nr:hypothetical protein [Methylococcus sp. EFPC2]QSA98511.1 hypothetical protein JWZ97_06840 [Methylococcus sp. EFPC2]